MKKNRGFTLIELIVVVAIMTVLLGVMVPSMNSILGFKAKRAANSITAALDETKTQAMSRLAAEVVISQDNTGCYITYNLHRGKKSGMVQEQQEKFADSHMNITYETSDGVTHQLKDQQLILTYDRENGGFAPVQTSALTTADLDEAVTKGTNVILKNQTTDSGNVYCKKITVATKFQKRIIELKVSTGTYSVRGEANEEG